MEKIYCSKCGAECKPDGIGTGYGVNQAGERICYKCCGEMDKEKLRNAKPGEKLHLYLTVNESGDSYLSNWPGTLKIRVLPWRGRHNMAGVRFDVWFSFGKKEFHGVQYGRDTQICHIKCLKQGR